MNPGSIMPEDLLISGSRPPPDEKGSAPAGKRFEKLVPVMPAWFGPPCVTRPGPSFLLDGESKYF